MNNDKTLATIKKFVAAWNDRGSEKSDAQMFWIELLSALGLDNISQAVDMEREVVVNNHTCFIDVFIRPTKVLIEQKSRGIDLSKPARQSDGSFLTPYDQAKRYADALPYSQRPRWIVTSNFDEFHIYDMDRLPSAVDDKPDAVKPRIVTFNHLVIDWRHLMFLVDPNDENIDEIKISVDAVKIIETVRDAFARKMLSHRRTKDDPVERLSVEQRNALNRFCVRLVFCLYAEDASIFAPDQFTNYLRDSVEPRKALSDLFDIFRTPVETRSPALEPSLKDFPFVGGKLFAEERYDVPEFNTEVKYLLTDRSKKFNWFAINPTIFGAMFESNLSDDTRRSGGMHFTSRSNIHRVIDPLFLDALHDEFRSIRRKRKNKIAALEEFQARIARLIFFDPACGSGNFLTETFISLRQLENRVLDELINLGVPCTIKVSIDQFYGVEINDFACAIAQTAMWISESKMLYDTDVGIREHIQYLPLKRSARIVCANALTLDWREVVPDGVDYILGNPPFVGYSFQSPEQKSELLSSTGLNNKKLDYVVGWYYKAADFMVDTETRAAFVSTNSICQGEQTAAVWKKLFETVHIDFARRTFKWLSESEDMAAVHCIIVGFSAAPNDKPKIIFDGNKKIIASNINAYLLDAPNFFVEKRTTPICEVPRMMNGNRPADGGNLIIETKVPKMMKGSQPTDGRSLIIEADEYEDFIRREPRAQKYIRRFIGAEEFLNGKKRWCLWLVDATEDDLQLPLIAERVERCRRFRLSSKKAATQKWAATPHLFTENRQPTNNFILVPVISSERRKYVPMDFLTAEVIPSNVVQIIPDAELFHFGVMMSIVHMAWMRTVCGRFELRYMYSNTIVYNNFPWCERSARIEDTARGILDARALYPTWTLAQLYDPNNMPSELRAAHDANDRAVMDAYGFDHSMSEAEIVSRLMEMYRRVTEGGRD